MIYDKVIIDGMNIVHKYRWVHKNLTDKKGKPTGIYYGVLDYCRRVLKKYPKCKINIVWDSPSLKKKIQNSNYKANRKKQSNDFYVQLAILKKLLSLYNITQYFAVGYEADDICFKIVKENIKDKILLVSNDADWYMMMSKNVDIYSNGNIKIIDDILFKLNLNNINEYKMFLSIIGTHNNVKGIFGIEKNPVKELIKQSTSFNKLFKSNSFKNRKQEIALQKIKINVGLIKENFKLIGFITDEYKIEEIKRKNNYEELIKSLKEYNMTTLIERLNSDKHMKDF